MSTDMIIDGKRATEDERMAVIVEMSRPDTEPQPVTPPMRIYTKLELLDIVEHDQHPQVRRIAAEMLYVMGARDQLAARTSQFSDFGVRTP
jgi:hypothetical protein